LIFFLAGVLAAYDSIGKVTLRYISSFSWEQVSASVTTLKLEKSRSKKSIYYRVKAQYSYTFQGLEYKSDRVSFDNERDSLGSYWQGLYKELKQDKTNDSVIAFVNPNDPSDVLLDRTFRGYEQVIFGVMFLFIFCGLGLILMWFCVKPVKTNEKIREDAKNGIQCEDKVAYWGLFCFGALFFIPAVGIFLLALPTIIAKGEYGALFVLIFALFGGWIMFHALVNQFRYKVIGPTPLFLDPLPGVIGGQVGGSFVVGYQPQNKVVTIKLNCKRYVRDKNDEGSSIELVWQRATQAYVEQTSNGFRVKFLFDCPADLPSSTDQEVFWEVCATGEVLTKSTVIKFDRTWKIPVEKAESIPSTIRIPDYFVEDQNELTQKEAEEDAGDLVQFDEQSGFIEVSSQRERSSDDIFSEIMIGLSFIAVGLLVISKGFPWFGSFAVVIGTLVFGVYLYGLGRSRNVKIDIESKALYMSQKMFGFVSDKREVDIIDPSQFTIKKSSTIEEKKKLIDCYNIEIRDKGGKVIIVEGIRGKDAADAVLNEIIEKVFS